MATSGSAFDFGFLPSSFPRNPVDFDLYVEQMAIGQILEPLVSADQYGNVVPAIAEKWEILDSGKSIRFFIDQNRVFSNGNKISSKDVVSSIERHWRNKKSQSFPLLQNILSLASEGNSVIIKLYKPQVAIFKILSRDHLGIMPANWTFNYESTEPYIGSGPYRFIKKEGKWYYSINQRYANPSAILVSEWGVVFAPKKTNDLQKINKIPDYAPGVSIQVLEMLKRNSNFDLNKYSIKPRPAFFQTSAWWNPLSSEYTDKLAQKMKMGIIRELFKIRRKHLNAIEAYGLIPMGVAGHLTQAILFPDLSLSSAKKYFLKSPKIKISVPERLKDDIFDLTDVAEIQKKYGVILEVILNEQFEKKGKSIDGSVDIIINRWAGGFNDPEGFIPIIGDIAPMPIDNYLGDLSSLFHRASEEQNWTTRSELFRHFDESLIRNERFVPGWKTETFTIMRKGFEEQQANLRYSPKILDLRKQIK